MSKFYYLNFGGLSSLNNLHFLQIFFLEQFWGSKLEKREKKYLNVEEDRWGLGLEGDVVSIRGSFSSNYMVDIILHITFYNFFQSEYEVAE